MMINISQLNFSHHKNKPPLFEGLDCQLESGSIVGLLGKNGAGKTTLLKVLTGLLSPQSGQISINNHLPIKRQPSFLEDLFFVSEEFHLPAIPAKKFVKVNSGFYPRFDRETFDKLVTEFELPDASNLQKMSYGQKKKFLISFALATKCRLLVLDEPTNGLDIPSKSIFRKVVASTLDEDQLVIISTHQVKDVENLIDKILLLEKGQFIFQKDLFDISSKLSFSFSQHKDSEDILYSEVIPGGFKVITSGEDLHSSVDIELLFNAITKGDGKILEYVQ